MPRLRANSLTFTLSGIRIRFRLYTVIPSALLWGLLFFQFPGAFQLLMAAWVYV